MTQPERDLTIASNPAAANDQRSDTLIKEDVLKLMSDIGMDMGDYELQVLNGVVILNADFIEKQSEHLLVSAIQAIQGVTDVRLNA